MVFAAVGLSVSLVGCGAGQQSGADASASPEGCDATASGSASDQIEVTGDVGSELTVEFPEPLTTEETQRTVLEAGDGDEVADSGSSVTADIAGYNATTGAAVADLTLADQTLVLGDQLIPSLNEALNCSVAGDRIAALIPPIEGIEQAGTDIGITAQDSVVIVADITDVAAPVAASPSPSISALPRADGVDQPAPAGYPTVTLAEDGTPTITMPSTPAPTELQIAVLKQGDGATVQDGADVVVHYVGAIYGTGTVFDSSWARGEPTTFNTSAVIAGFTQALVGQQVGSQVIAVIPPAEGYGENPPSGSGIAATDTLVFVVDILGTA